MNLPPENLTSASATSPSLPWSTILGVVLGLLGIFGTLGLIAQFIREWWPESRLAEKITSPAARMVPLLHLISLSIRRQ